MVGRAQTLVEAVSSTTSGSRFARRALYRKSTRFVGPRQVTSMPRFGGLDAYHELRNRWSTYLMVLLLLSAVFQWAMIGSVASGIWKFQGQEAFLNGVGAEPFIQVVGMGYIVVRCLFPAPDPSKELRNSRRADRRNGKSNADQKAP